MSCSQSGCGDPVVCSMIWPGSGRLHYCSAHRLKQLMALGAFLQELATHVTRAFHDDVNAEQQRALEALHARILRTRDVALAAALAFKGEE